MKITSKRFWRFVNVGFPNDSEEGEGTLKEFAQAVVAFWSKIQMGSRVDIQLFRSESDRANGNKTQGQREAEGILDGLFDGLDSEGE